MTTAVIIFAVLICGGSAIWGGLWLVSEVCDE